jgi:hypothetical protein
VKKLKALFWWLKFWTWDYFWDAIKPKKDD